MGIAPFVNKWAHLMSIVFVLGAVLYERFVSIPALKGSGIEESEAWHGLRRRWGITVGVLWLIILATGAINVYFVAPHVSKAYFLVLGVKVALAIIMFLATVAISHPIPFLESLQAARSHILTLLAILGLIVVGISAYLNMSRMSASVSVQSPPAPAAPQ